MPARTHYSAPNFDGEPAKIRRYFRDLESLFLHAEINDDKQKITYACVYTSHDVEDLWSGLPQAEADPAVYEEFKKAVIELYGEAAEGRTYTIQDLYDLVRESGGIGVSTDADLLEYYRNFLRIAAYLSREGGVGEGHRGAAFIRGLGPTLEKRVRDYLLIRLPAHNAKDPYKEEDVLQAAKRLLKFDSLEKLADARERSTKQVSASQESLAQSLQELRTQVDLLTQIVANSNGTAVPLFIPPIPFNLPSSTPHPNMPSAGRCAFCSNSTHRICECPVAHEYLASGKCVRNGDGRIVLPNNEEISRGLNGRDLKEKIDSWHRAISGNAPTVTSSFRDPPPLIPASIPTSGIGDKVMETVHSHREEDEEDEDDEDDEELVRIRILLKGIESELRNRRNREKRSRADDNDNHRAKISRVSIY